MSARWLVLVVAACTSAPNHARVSSGPSPTAAAPPSAPPSPTPTAPLPPPPPSPTLTVALAPISAPYGDINAPTYVKRFTADLRAASILHGPFVVIADPSDDCFDDAAACALQAGKRAGADVVVYGMLIHSSEGDSTEIHLEAIEIGSLVHRTWEETPLDSAQFFAEAAARAYATLVTGTP